MSPGRHKARCLRAYLLFRGRGAHASTELFLTSAGRAARAVRDLQRDRPVEGGVDGLEDHPDPRVRQFVRGEAGERLSEMSQGRG